MPLREQLTEALGVLRNGVGSVTNLQQLLSSVRVGPQQLQSAIGGVHDDCEALAQATVTISEALRALGVASASAEELGQHLIESVRLLQEGLASAAAQRRLTVPARLQIERVVRTASERLEGCLPLAVSLVHVASTASAEHPPAAPSMVHEAPAAPFGFGRIRRVALHIDAETRRLDLGIDVDAGRALIALCLTLLGVEEATSCQVGHFRVPGGGASTTLAVRSSAADGGMPSVRLAYAPQVGPSLSCTTEVARLMGVSLRARPKARAIDIAWTTSVEVPTSSRPLS